MLNVIAHCNAKTLDSVRKVDVASVFGIPQAEMVSLLDVLVHSAALCCIRNGYCLSGTLMQLHPLQSSVFDIPPIILSTRVAATRTLRAGLANHTA